MLRNRNEARRQLWWFIGLTAALSLPLYTVFLLLGGSVRESGGLIFVLMWVPALAAVILRLAHGELFRGAGVKALKLGIPRGRRGAVAAACGLAALFPAAVGLASYGVTWTTGLASFTGTPGLPFLGAVLRAAVLGSLFGIPQVLGEEIGWRGYMSEKFSEAGYRAPCVLGGLIWAFWHTPLILSGQYAAGPFPAVSVLSFAVLMVALHCLWSHWTLHTGSVWPAVVGHGAWNTLIQFTFDGHTEGIRAALWVGDSGIITVGITALLVFLVPAGLRWAVR
jgi:membrane protease YdiL (CAAX protease family)